MIRIVVTPDTTEKEFHARLNSMPEATTLRVSSRTSLDVAGPIIARLGNVRSLHVSIVDTRNRIDADATERIVEAVADMGTLRELELNYAPHSLARAVSFLTRLDLDSDVLYHGRELFKGIANSKTLTTLTIRTTSAHSEFSDAVMKCSSLRALDVFNEDDVRHLAAWMGKLTSITASHAPTADIALFCEALVNSPTLKHVKVRQWNLTDWQAREVAAAIIASRTIMSFVVTWPVSVARIIDEAMETVHARHGVLALDAANITSRGTSAGRFTRSDGDHALTSRVLRFLV